MGNLDYDSDVFLARYPEFTSVSESSLLAYWEEAYDFFGGADSLVSDEGKRRRLLNMLTAHIAAVNGALAADGMPLPVGKVSQASKGSVSASFEFIQPGTHSWYTQTQYGAAFWQATLNLRRFRYVSQPTVW